MYVFGFTAKHPEGKVYTAVGVSTGYHFVAYGPATSPQRAAKTDSPQHANIEGVIEAIRRLYVEKTSRKGYTLAHAGVAQITEAMRPDQILAAFYQQQGLDSFVPSSLSAAMGSFRRMTAINDAPAPVPAPTRVADREQGLRAPEGTVFTRPNGEVYLPRLVGGHVDVMLLRAFRTMPRPVNALLVGPAGSGKTAVAEVAHPDLITIAGHGDMTVAQIVGQLMPTPEGGWKFVEGPLTVAMREGRALLIDEINRLPHEVISVLHSAGDGRGWVRLDDRPDEPIVHAAKGFCMLGTLNPDQMGSTGLPEAITSRFAVQIDVSSDFDAARKMGVPETFVTVAENLHTRNADPQAVPVWEPQMRELLAAKANVDAGLGETFAAAAMLGQCPVPEDRPVVAEVMGNVFGRTITPLALGPQA